jgi:hypothetical protein
VRADENKEWYKCDDYDVKPRDPEEEFINEKGQKCNTKSDAYIVVLKKSS